VVEAQKQFGNPKGRGTPVVGISFEVKLPSACSFIVDGLFPMPPSLRGAGDSKRVICCGQGETKTRQHQTFEKPKVYNVHWRVSLLSSSGINFKLN
jgi:hypothetical protein